MKRVSVVVFLLTGKLWTLPLVKSNYSANTGLIVEISSNTIDVNIRFGLGAKQLNCNFVDKLFCSDPRQSHRGVTYC